MGGTFYPIRRHRAGGSARVFLGDFFPQKRKKAAHTPPPPPLLAQSHARGERRTAASPRGGKKIRANAAVMQHSRAITKKSASNLALAFVLLPKQKRDAMSALYAFCREVDDVADNETVPAETRRVQLAEWRDDVKRACESRWGETPSSPNFPVNRELQPIIQKFGLRFELFDTLIKGCEMDL